MRPRKGADSAALTNEDEANPAAIAPVAVVIRVRRFILHIRGAAAGFIRILSALKETGMPPRTLALKYQPTMTMPSPIPMHRRNFLTNLGAAGAGLLILPSGSRAQGASPNSKLNIALIGTWGRGEAHFSTLAKENVVAICDVNEEHLASGAKQFPQATTYTDWRKLLDHKGLEAVMICSTDHTHAHITIWAMNRGLHVYCEKPLAITVEEARLVRETYLKNRGKLATQVGTQRHAIENFQRVRELIQDGAIGEVSQAHAWGDRKLGKPGYPPAQGEPPKHLHYDLWIGPSPFHPYNPDYFSGGSGMNCLQWNMYWDFGTGQVGDMGSHTMDLVWNALDLTLPVSAEASGDPFNPDVTPVKLDASWEFARPGKEPLGVHWYQGGALPRSPKAHVDLAKIGHGAMFRGDKGTLICDFDSRMILPGGANADMTYYKRRDKENVIPGIPSFQGEWIDACKGKGKTSCDFEYGGNMIEMMLLGLVAYRAGKKLKYDASTMTTDDPAANQLLRRAYREGWPLVG